VGWGPATKVEQSQALHRNWEETVNENVYIRSKQILLMRKPLLFHLYICSFHGSLFFGVFSLVSLTVDLNACCKAEQGRYPGRYEVCVCGKLRITVCYFIIEHIFRLEFLGNFDLATVSVLSFWEVWSLRLFHSVVTFVSLSASWQVG
jgi:hypothetical protein